MPVSKKEISPCSDRCHAVGRRWPMERNDSMAAIGRATADERAATEHFWDHGADV